MRYRYLTPEDYETAAKNGINEHTVNARVRRSGWPIEIAITEPVSKRTNHKEWMKIAKENGISHSTYCSRVHQLGWTPEEASTTPIMNRSEAGKRTKPSPRIKLSKELIEKAEKHNINRKNLYNRIKLGWDEEVAATYPVLTKAESGRRGGYKHGEQRRQG